MPRWFLYLPMKPEERAQHRWPPVSEASTPLLPHIGSMGRPAIPFMPLIDQHVFQTAVLKRSAPRTLLISRFHVKHAPHCVGIASAQSGLRCTVSSVILMLRCGGGCIHNPSEGVKPPAAWLRAEHQRPAHAIRCTTGFYSSRRNARGTLASYSSLGDGRDSTSPGGGPRIPFPHTRMNPGSIDVTPPAESERELSSATYGGFT